ncbi:MAG: transcriptional repressor NrdR [Aeriscardovia sp.]|nr:transcriptional repressor NrdR [Aeriscardovia sp.]
MRCPFCQFPCTKVVDTRDNDKGTSVRRRRVCQRCRRKFTTVESTQLLVCKKNGCFEPFNEGKIANGLIKACKGRPVAYKEVLRIAQEVGDRIRSTGTGQISSRDIGLAVLEPLKRLDGVAYLRFASVYENFDSPEDFKRAAIELKNAK